MPKKALIVYCFLALTMIGSALTVVSRPAYSRYVELSAEIERRMEEQRKHFDGEVMVAISNIVSSAAYLAGENIRLTSELQRLGVNRQVSESVDCPVMSNKSFDTLKIHPFSDYEYSYARISDREIESIRLGDWRYKKGDTFLGLEITHISPDCTILSDGTMLVPDKLYGKIKESNIENGNDFFCRSREDAKAALSALRNPIEKGNTIP